MAPSIWLFCRAPELLKVQEIFSTMSTKISSRTLPSVREVSRMDLMTPVGPLPTPEKSDPLPLYTAHLGSCSSFCTLSCSWPCIQRCICCKDPVTNPAGEMHLWQGRGGGLQPLRGLILMSA